MSDNENKETAAKILKFTRPTSHTDIAEVKADTPPWDADALIAKFLEARKVDDIQADRLLLLWQNRDVTQYGFMTSGLLYPEILVMTEQLKNYLITQYPFYIGTDS